jgi:hypothetical protein
MITRFVDWLDDESFWRWLISAHLVVGHLTLAMRAWNDGALFWLQMPFLVGGLGLMLTWLFRVGRA